MSHARDVIQGVIDDLRALELFIGDPNAWRDTAEASAARLARRLSDVVEAVPAEPFDKRCADALADEVDLLVRKKVIDSRSPAADALLSYRDPPTSPRSDHLLEIERHDALGRENAMLRLELDRVKAELAAIRMQEGTF